MKLGIVFGLFMFAVVISATTATYDITTPEVGITCVQVDNIFGGRTPAGCYKGDITKDDNCLDVKATVKYQHEGTVLYFDNDTCIGGKTPKISNVSYSL